MSVALNLAPRLAVERIRATRGAGVLDAMAVLAFTVSSWLGLTVAGGTWMFIQRWRVDGALVDPTWAEVAPAYVGLAGFACALLTIPVLALGGAAARLGARGRSRRLASLRLIGMTSGEVVRMSAIETLVQVVAGVVLGSVVFAASLPAWQLIGFQGQHIEAREMLPPWWLWMAVVGVLLVLAMVSTIVGLRRVSISPLGVARDETPRRLRTWRLVLVVVLVTGFMVYVRSADLSNLVALVSVVVLLTMVIGSITVVGPWLLQLVAKPRTHTSKVAKLLAARRILDDPRAAWRNVASVALLGFIAGFTVNVPVTTGDGSTDVYMESFVHDIQTGVSITLIVGLILAATATLISQASGVFDRAPEAVAMDRMGVPRSLHAAVRRSQVLVPLAVALGTSVPLGFLLSTVTATQTEGFPTLGVVLLTCTVLVGFLLTLGAAEACRPLQTGVLGEQRRRND